MYRVCDVHHGKLVDDRVWSWERWSWVLVRWIMQRLELSAGADKLDSDTWSGVAPGFRCGE